MAMTMKMTYFQSAAPYILMFQSNLLRLSPQLKMDAESFSETSAHMHQTVL
jgi:hypothetical protein